MNRSLLFAALAALAACQPDGDAILIVGQLESERIELAAEFAEPIVQRLVVEGQTVSKGDTVIRQDDRRAAARLREAQAALAQSQARLDELVRGPRREKIEAVQANVAGAEQEVDFRERQLERAQSLLDRHLGPPDARDSARAALDAATANLEVLQAQLEELLAGTTIEELNQARAAADRSSAQVEQLALDLERLSTRAPMDGTVDSLLLQPGERPQPGMPMAILLAGAQPYARVYVPEASRATVIPGSRVTVHVDGRDQPVSGRVRWVASEPAFTPYFALTEHDRGRLSYAAKIDLEVTGPRLPDGVPVQVELKRNE